MSERIAVVIPHYQRSSGVLSRTLGAIFQQSHRAAPRVVIVDDSSPAPAADEVATLQPHNRDRVTIIRQPNGGPARARNTALDAVAGDVDYVALSDCDDVWPTWHLEDAMVAMRSGFDFFFGDHFREGTTGSRSRALGLDPAQHECIDADRHLYAWRGDMFDTALRAPLVGLSTVVFRTSKLAG